MKRKIIIILLITLMLVTSVLTITSAPVKAQTNMELSIYERFINKQTYEHLGSVSIWKYDIDYNDALLNSLNRLYPIMTVSVE